MKKGKAKFEAVRWTIERAASEFDINPRTLAKRLKVAGMLAGKDKKFSTAEICRAKYGDYELERTRKMKEDADAAALGNAARRGELLELAECRRWIEQAAAQLRQEILAGPGSDADKDAKLNDLARVVRMFADGFDGADRAPERAQAAGPGPGDRVDPRTAAAA